MIIYTPFQFPNITLFLFDFFDAIILLFHVSPRYFIFRRKHVAKH